jgi:hypothetical protein
MLYNPIIKAFKELDAEMLERQIAWALGRVAALKEFNPDEDEWVQAGKQHGSHEYFGRKVMKQHEIAGGKTWYNTFYGRSEQDIVGIVAKNVAAIIEKRNHRIVTALTKKGITEIPEFTLIHCSDGYEGTFIVAGHKVHIETILAGGYNIQCLHQRTLINVKAAA